jgi:hypothetical protein
MSSASVSPSEATPLIQNNSNNGNTYTSANGKGTDNYRLSNLRMSLHRSMSTFEEAISSMRRIGYLGSMSIAVNSLTGPAM